MRKNDIVEIDITSYTHEGLGVGRVDGYVLFVPQAACGDRLKCLVVKTLSSHGYAKILEILTPSPDRKAPDCKVFEHCGGCCFRHISYEAELEAKRIFAASELRKGLGRDVPCKPCVPSPYVLQYRNKALIPFGQAGYGFYKPRSHDIVLCEHCPIQSKEASFAASVLQSHIRKFGISAYDELSHTGLVRGIFVRTARATGQVMVVVIINGNKIPHCEELTVSLKAGLQGLASVQICKNKKRTNVPLDGEFEVLYGSRYIEDVLAKNRYRISAQSFYQINSAQCEALYEAAMQLAGLSGEERVLDLYCGIGTIGLTLAKNALEVVGVEIVPDAIEDAQYAVDINGIKNATFITADAASAAKQLAAAGFAADVVILDPPRKGCEAQLLGTVAEMSPEKIVYISCNPPTLARDARLLEEFGYKITGSAAPFDMFAGTSHVETVVLLSKAACTV